MDAKSLMIGDWVCGALGDMKVVALGATITGHRMSRDGTIHETDCNPNFVEPIEITEEILKANGFVDGILPYTLCNTELQLSIQDNNGFWAFSIYADDTEFCDLMIMYVHELQHALRLCGLNEFADKFKIV